MAEYLFAVGDKVKLTHAHIKGLERAGLYNPPVDLAIYEVTRRVTPRVVEISDGKRMLARMMHEENLALAKMEA